MPKEEETFEGWTKLRLDQVRPGAILGVKHKEGELLKVVPFAVAFYFGTVSSKRAKNWDVFCLCHCPILRLGRFKLKKEGAVF